MTKKEKAMARRDFIAAVMLGTVAATAVVKGKAIGGNTFLQNILQVKVSVDENGMLKQMVKKK